MQDCCGNLCIIRRQNAEQHRRSHLLLQCHILIRGCAHFAWIPCPYVILFLNFGRDFFAVMRPTSVQGSLELASKNFITGATKIVYAVIYSLILVSLIQPDH